MPALLEKSAQDTASSTLLSRVLRSRYQWERWRGVLFSLVIGLTATLLTLWALHPSWQTPVNWKILVRIWSGGLLLTALGAALARHFAPSSWLAVAQEMDRNLIAKNRLEATAVLHASATPLAEAQRKETSAYLSRVAGGTRPVRILPWLVGSVLVLMIAHLSTLAIWVIPMLHQAASVIVPSPRELALPKASITWKSPEPESKANPIEEVPAVAIAQSTTGLENLSLEISVNGALKKSVSLPPKPFDQPGQNTLKVSLFMDELEVAPFDVVSYFIRARRITEQKVPDTTSPIQFIQVRPFRNDVTQEPDAQGTQNFNLLIELKLAELRSVKENFILAHTDLTATNPVRVRENNRVGTNQAELSAKTEEIVQAFIEAGYSADMIDLLRQAEPAMGDASKKILATQNSDALPSQEKALNLIVEVEKFFQKVISDKNKGSDSSPPDPFKDKQQHELKKRSELAAGQLEQLTKNQSKLANDLDQPDSTNPSNRPANGTGDTAIQPTAENHGTNSGGASEANPPSSLQAVDPFGPDADKGTLAERQTRVVQGIETLLNTNSPLSPAASQALQDAQKDASESMKQLDQGDEADAREPAANAAQDLRRAVLEMNKAGEEDAKQTMEESQQKLNDLARQLRDLVQKGSPDAPQALDNLARQVVDARKQLEEAADRQQAAGSADGAQRLQRLAKAISDQNVENDLAGMGKTGLDGNKAQTDAQKLEALAGQAAQDTASAKPSARDIAHLIDSLERSRANLARLAQLSGGSQSAPADQKGTPPGQSPSPEKNGDQNMGKSATLAAAAGGESPGSEQSDATDQQSSATTLGNGVKPDSTGKTTEIEKAYQEVIADLRDETERTEATVPPATAAALKTAVASVEPGTRDHSAANGDIGHAYQIISGPLNILIANLVGQAAQAQRQEVVKQPDLDEAPAAYRSAVSDYFETMSRDYHPDGDDQDTKKP